MRALLFFLTFSSTAAAQFDQDFGLTFEPSIYYFPFYNGEQLIEVNYFANSLAQAAHRDAMFPRGDSDYHDAISFDTPNGFILRSSTGRVIKTFGIDDMNSIKLLPPNDAATITHRERLNMSKLEGEFEDYTWKDANGYGYRYIEARKPIDQENQWSGLNYYVGIIDTLGNVMLQDVDYFSYSDGEYLVSSNSKHAIYDSTFTQTMNYVDGTVSRAAPHTYFHVTLEGETKIIDRFGKLIDNDHYVRLEPARYEGGYIYSIQTESGIKWGIMRSDLSKVTPALYRDIRVLPRGYVVSDSSLSFALLNENGLQITEFGYEPNAFRYYIDGSYTVYKRNPEFRQGMIDSLGNVIIPMIYERVIEFRNGLAAVSLNGKWGIVNRQGEVQGEIAYSEIIEIRNKHVYVKLDGKRGVISHKGEVILEPSYNSVSCLDHDFFYLSNFQNERFIYNIATKEVIPCEYYSIGCFNEGVSVVSVADKSGMIDTNMNVVIPIEYDYMSEFLNGTAVVKKGKFYGLYNRDFELIKSVKFDFFRVAKSGEYEVF